MRHRGLLAAFALAVMLCLLVPAGATAAPEVDGFTVVAGGVSRAETFDAPKSASRKLAQSDPTLLEETSAELINVWSSSTTTRSRPTRATSPV